MNAAKEFDALMAQYERNSNTGSLKAANSTLSKILRLMWAQTAAGAADPAAVDVAKDIAYFTAKLAGGLTIPDMPMAPEPPVEAAKMPDEPVVNAPEAVIEEAPVEEAPVEETVIEETVIEETVIEEAPAEEVPVEDPAEAPVEAAEASEEASGAVDADDAPKARRGRKGA